VAYIVRGLYSPPSAHFTAKAYDTTSSLSRRPLLALLLHTLLALLWPLQSEAFTSPPSAHFIARAYDTTSSLGWRL